MFGLDKFSMGIVTLVVTVAVGLMVLSGFTGMSMTYGTTTVQDEEHVGTDVGTLPANITVDVASNADFYKLAGVNELLWYDSTAGSNVTVSSDDYEIVDEENGTVEITNTSGDLADYDETSDSFYISYDYDEEGETYDAVTSGIDNLGSIMPWVGIIVIVVVATIILNLLRSRGGLSGGTTMRK